MKFKSDATILNGFNHFRVKHHTTYLIPWHTDGKPANLRTAIDKIIKNSVHAMYTIHIILLRFAFSFSFVSFHPAGRQPVNKLPRMRYRACPTACVSRGWRMYHNIIFNCDLLQSNINTLRDVYFTTLLKFATILILYCRVRVQKVAFVVLPPYYNVCRRSWWSYRVCHCSRYEWDPKKTFRVETDSRWNRGNWGRMNLIFSLFDSEWFTVIRKL